MHGMDEYTRATYQLIHDFKNEYAATMYVAQQTRKLLTQSRNALTESEAMSWVVSRKPKSELSQYIQKCNPRIRHRKYSLLNNYAASIDDIELRKCFQDSAVKSMKAHKLIINYSELDDANCTRLRILLKQYWLEYLETSLPDTPLHSF
jgi:hypothetical protein